MRVSSHGRTTQGATGPGLPQTLKMENESVWIQPAGIAVLGQISSDSARARPAGRTPNPCTTVTVMTRNDRKRRIIAVPLSLVHDEHADEYREVRVLRVVL